MRQGDGFSPLIFNYTLEKVINEWLEEKSVRKLDQPIKSGKANIKIDCQTIKFLQNWGSCRV